MLRRCVRLLVPTLFCIGLVLVSGDFISFAKEIYHEAPMLSDMVQEGKIPPIAKRLPENPMVVKPLREIGKYGGT